MYKQLQNKSVTKPYLIVLSSFFLFFKPSDYNHLIYFITIDLDMIHGFLNALQFLFLYSIFSHSLIQVDYIIFSGKIIFHLKKYLQVVLVDMTKNSLELKRKNSYTILRVDRLADKIFLKLTKTHIFR